MSEHFAEHITLEEICKRSGLSKSTLLRAFTKSKGITPYRYLQTVRKSKAKELLEQGVSPVDAAIQTGFSDQSHFSSFFHMFIGLSHVFQKAEEQLKTQFFIGFIVAMAGICLISFSGSELELNPAGDILAVVAAFVWAVYSLLTRKISGYGYHTLQTTKRIFTYGILFMLPFLFVFDFNLDMRRFKNPVYILNKQFPNHT